MKPRGFENIPCKDSSQSLAIDSLSTWSYLRAWLLVGKKIKEFPQDSSQKMALFRRNPADALRTRLLTLEERRW